MSCVYHDAALPIILGAALALAFTTLRSKPFSTHLQGPTSPSWLYGNFQQIFLAIPYGNYEFEWQKLYGMVYRVRGCFGSEHLMVSDGLALRYIINNTSIFTKPPQVQWVNRLGLGSESLLTAVGEQHRRLRVVMNPIFSAVELKKVVPTIQKAAWDASQRLATICNENENRSIDILPLLHNITLQAVGESIMGYNFASNEMFAKCYETLVVSVSRRGKAGLLADAIIPRLPRWVTSLLAYFPPQDLAKLIEHRELSNKIAQSVLESKMEDIKLGLDPEGDLIGRLVHSNTRNTLNQISIEEIKDQFGTINAAGEDTTANALSWALFQLSANHEWQHELREEIIHHNASITEGNYDTLPFLNAFIKETLRFYSPVPILPRVASSDAVIPLSRTITTNSGEEIREVIVKKGQLVLGAIQSYHRSTAVWGEDGCHFIPSRWLRNNLQPLDSSSIGPYANLAAFWGGSRTCIGWRYAVLEMQIMLCEFIRNFSFDIQDVNDVHQGFAITAVPVNSTGKVGLMLMINSLR